MNGNAEPKALVQIISEENFLPFVQNFCPDFFKVYNLFKSLVEDKAEISKKLYSHLIQEVEFLESFLDEHGARENKTWYFFAEYVASIRNLGIAAFFLKHLMDRYPCYRLLEPEDSQKKFYADSQDTLNFLNQSVLNLFQETVAVGKINGLVFPEKSMLPDDFPEFQSNTVLPRNISEDQVKGEEEWVVDLCEKIQKVAGMMSETSINLSADAAARKKLIIENINEKNARMYANLIHSAQSDFDTYIKNTRIEQKYPSLKNIRGYISISLHLMEIVLWLSHFYERHEDDIRQGECKKKISDLVDKTRLLSIVLNFGFYYSQFYIQEGGKLSEEILNRIVKTVRYEAPIPKPHGFHARPSTYISLIARKHDKNIFLIVDGEKYNVRSVMSLLQAGGMIADKGYQKVVFEGERKAIDDIRVLAEHNYCENSDIPPQLSYLTSLKTPA
ncbi:MAG: HPr family phosphocarrier protein [Nitrospinales bacterium]